MQVPAEGSADSAEAQIPAVNRAAGAARGRDTIILQDASGGGDRVVEVAKLTPADRKLLVKGVLASEDQDQEQFLTQLRARLDRAGIEPSTVEVRYESLHVEANAYVGGRALPTVLNSYLNIVESVLMRMHLRRGSKKPFVILDNMSGVIQPGRMTLLLGPPGSGKSTLLKALAGKFQQSGVPQVKGSITYNGHGFDQFVPVRTASYINQYDTHLAELTVRETLDFSARCQGPGSRPNQLQRLLEKEGQEGQQHAAANSFLQADTLAGQRNAIITDYVIRILGLDVCADIPVGSAMIRGISGGQKKRVTTGEMLVGPQQVLFMDEISTGLDSSTTFQVVKCMRDFTHLRSGTVLMALLQPAPEVYDLFDDVLLMSEGRTIYHGPREGVEGFFQGLGFRCPNRKGIADFLQEVTSPKDQQQYWAREEAWSFVPGDMFVEAFSRHQSGQAMAAQLSQPLDQSRHKPDSLITTRYALSGLPALRAMIDRELVLMRRTFFVYIVKAVQSGIVAFVVATLFLRTHIHSHTIQDANLVAGMLFFTLIQSLFSGIAEMTFAIQRLPTFFKHRDNNFFPTWTYILPISITRIPASLLEATIFTVVTYFAVPLSIDAGRFFLNWLILFLLHNMAITQFRTVGALTRNIVVANACGSLTLLLTLMMGGFVIPKTNVHPWVVWIYWIDPLQWAQRGVTISQFTSKLWTSTILRGGARGIPLGNQELAIRGFPNKFWWVWICIGALILANVILHMILLWAAKYLGPYGGTANIQSEESLAQREYAKHGGEGYADVSLQVTQKEKSQRQAQLQQLKGASARSLQSQGGQKLSSKALHKGQESSRDLTASSGGSRKVLDSGTAEAQSQGPLAQDAELKVEAGPVSFKQPKVASGMTLPFVPMTMTFTDVHYFVNCPPGMVGKGLPQVGQKDGKEMLELLQGISGAFRPGILTCLMGVSGAGKTTLMDVLSGRKTGGVIAGDVRLNGHPKEQASFTRVSGYVEQFDIHSPRTTVREALQFSADLRFNGYPGKAAMHAFVDEVMDLVELHPNRNSLVGSPGVEGLSVEQRKRLTIAVELVANPSIVFMDEPTSGLDARAAAIVMRTVRNIVDTGRTIVCTIHQPSIDIFESFDELLLLKSGGRTIYAGNLGQNSMDLVKYFQGIHGVGSVSAGLNPATWMLQVTTPGNAAQLGIDFADYYEASPLRKRMDAIIERSSQPDPAQPPLQFHSEHARGAVSQYVICLRKFFITFWRNPEYNATRFTFSLAVALFFGAVFWQLGGRSDTETAIYSTMGALLVASLFLGILNSVFVQPVIGSERQVFYRERAAGMYAVFPWYLGMATVEAGYLLLQSILYVAVVYWMAGFISKPEQLFWFLLYNLLTLMYFTYYGVAAVACTPNILIAAIVSGFFYGLMNLTSGFVIPRPHIPGWWCWFYYINPVSWTLYGLVTSNLGKQENLLQLNNGQIVTVPEFLYNNFHYQHDMVGYIVLILAAFVTAFWTAGWAAFRYLNFNRR